MTNQLVHASVHMLLFLFYIINKVVMWSPSVSDHHHTSQNLCQRVGGLLTVHDKDGKQLEK